MHKLMFSCLTISLLAASCGTASPQGSAPPATGPKPITLAGTYQVDFRLGNADQASAQIQRAGGNTVGSQTLNNAPDLVFDSNPVVVRTHVAVKNGVKVRHISATFGVLNNTASTLGNFTFLPVIRSDLDSDPTNNAQTATVGSTPFMSVRLFDGSDGSFNAAAMQTMGAQYVDAATGVFINDPSASPYLTDLDVSQLSVPVSPGMQTTVMNRGWRVANVFAPHTTKNVTFAVELPVDPANPRNQPYSFSLLVTGAHEAGAALVPDVMQNVIQGWTFGAGESLHAEMPGFVVLHTSDIQADGSVDGRLPTPPSLRAFFNDPCIYTGTKNVANFAFNHIIDWRVISSQGDVLGTVAERTPDGKPVVRLYSETTVQATGTEQCPYNIAARRDFDFSLARGWNALVVSQEGAVTSYRNLTPGVATTLTFTPRPEKLSMTFINTSPLVVPIGGAPVVRDVQIKQDGGLSGDVTLEVDRPSVTVSPSALTLPSFSAASVPLSGTGPQALTPRLSFSAAQGASPVKGPMNLIARRAGVEVGRVAITLDMGTPSVSTYTDARPRLVAGQAQTAPVAVTVTSLYGYSGPVTLTASRLPAGMTASPVTTNVTAGGTATATLILTTDTTIQRGSPYVTLTGTPVSVAGGVYVEIQ